MRRRHTLTSALGGLVLALATTGPVWAQEEADPRLPSDDVTAELTSPIAAPSVIEEGPWAGAVMTPRINYGHGAYAVTDVQRNVDEDLSNQPIRDDDDDEEASSSATTSG